MVRVDGVVDGGAAQRPLGDGAGGHRLVVAGLGAVGARPGRAQLPDGLRVRAQRGGDRGGAGQRGARLRERVQRLGQPGGGPVGRGQPFVQLGDPGLALGDAGGPAAGPGGRSDVLGVLLGADHGGCREQLTVQ